MNGWFGDEMDGTPASQYQIRVPVPVGEKCHYCGTVIADWDSGTVMPFHDGKGPRPVYQHQECSIYTVMGSRWCRAEGAEQRSAQHKRYHELQHATYGIMRPRAVERRVLLEFGEFIDEDELRNNWRAHRNE